MKKLFLFITIVLAHEVYCAENYDFEYNGLQYQITQDNEVEVVGYNSSYTFSDLNIGGDVYYNSQTYTVTKIDKYALYGCTTFTIVRVENCTIENYAFTACTALTEATLVNCTIPDGVNGDVNPQYYSVFYLCDNFTSITIIDSTIGKNAFSGNNSLTTVTITGGTIGDYAFAPPSSGNTEITSLKIETLNISNDVIFGTQSFQSCTSETSTVTITGCTINDATIFQSTTIQNLTLVDSEITVESFANSITITNLHITNSVIGQKAFANCSNLTNLTVSDCELSQSVFSGTGLTTIELTNCTLDGLVFQDCKALTTATIINCEIKSGDTFEGTALATLYIEDSTIDQYAFYGLPLTSITIKNCTVDDYAFWQCTGENADVTIENSTFANSAFYQCSNAYNTVTIDNTEISGSIFESSSISALNIKNTTISSTAFSSAEITTLNITNCTISENAFANDETLTTITFSGNVTIGDLAFNGCSIEKVTIIDILDPPTITTAETFTTTETARLIIPDGTYSAYENSIWGELFFIVGYDFLQDGIYYIIYTDKNGEDKVEIVPWYNQYEGDLVIPATVEGYEVGRIYEGAFKDSNINSLTICTTEVLNDVHLWDIVALYESGCTLYVPAEYADDYWVRWGLIIPESSIVGDESIVIAKNEDTTVEDPSENAIKNITTNIYEVARYNLQGEQISQPQKGINFIKYSDGSTRKVLVK